MNRSVVRERSKSSTQVVEGEVVVARRLEIPVRGKVRCAAAPLVAGELRRRGIRVRFGTFGAPRAGQDGAGAELDVTSWLDREGRPIGFGAAAHSADAAALAATKEVMDEWSSVLRTRRMVLTEVTPACWGMRRAVAAAGRALTRGDPVYLLGRMVAEAHVADEMAGRGAKVATDLAAVPAGATVVFPAHGVSRSVRADAAALELSVVDATCPLVARVHADVEKFVRRGDTVVVIGRAGHAMLEPLLASAPEDIRVVENAEDVRRLEFAFPDRVSFLVAPGFPVEEATAVITALRHAVPRVRAQHPDGLCYAASDRAEAVGGVAKASDVFLVVGAADDPDVRVAVEWARAAGCPEVHAVAGVEEIRPRWLASAWSIGVTNSLSAAPQVVDDIATAVAGLGPMAVVRREVDTYDTALGVPAWHAPSPPPAAPAEPIRTG